MIPFDKSSSRILYLDQVVLSELPDLPIIAVEFSSLGYIKLSIRTSLPRQERRIEREIQKLCDIKIST
jgi:hypothetical protein